MIDQYVSLAVGLFLVLLGCGMIASHVRTKRRHEADPDLDEREQAFFARQFRRRIQASSLLAIIGILLPIGDNQFVDWTQRKASWAAFWALVLLLLGWVLLIAVLDWLATSVHVRNSRNALARLERKQAELQAELHRLQSLSPSNEDPPSPPNSRNISL